MRTVRQGFTQKAVQPSAWDFQVQTEESPEQPGLTPITNSAWTGDLIEHFLMSRLSNWYYFIILHENHWLDKTSNIFVSAYEELYATKNLFYIQNTDWRVSFGVIYIYIIGIPKIVSCLKGVILHADQSSIAIFKSSSYTQFCSLFSSSSSYGSENFLLLNMAKSC